MPGTAIPPLHRSERGEARQIRSRDLLAPERPPRQRRPEGDGTRRQIAREGSQQSAVQHRAEDALHGEVGEHGEHRRRHAQPEHRDFSPALAARSRLAAEETMREEQEGRRRRCEVEADVLLEQEREPDAEPRSADGAETATLRVREQQRDRTGRRAHREVPVEIRAEGWPGDELEAEQADAEERRAPAIEQAERRKVEGHDEQAVRARGEPARHRDVLAKDPHEEREQIGASRKPVGIDVPVKDTAVQDLRGGGEDGTFVVHGHTRLDEQGREGGGGEEQACCDDRRTEDHLPARHSM